MLLKIFENWESESEKFQYLTLAYWNCKINFLVQKHNFLIRICNPIKHTSLLCYLIDYSSICIEIKT
jgi:hypothetical protein